MNTEMGKSYQFIFWGLIFLFLGLMTSPTGVSLYHILIFVPTVFLIIQGDRIQISKSSWCLILLSVWGVIATFYNYGTLVKPFKAFQDVKYYLFGIFSIITLRFFFQNAPLKHKKALLKILLLTVIVGFFVGIGKSWFGFDVVKWRSGDFHPRSGGFTNYMRYGYASSFLLLFGIAAWFNFDKVKKYISKKWLIVFITFNIAAILTAQTRGAVLGLSVGLPFLLLRYKPIIGKSLFGLGITGILAIGVYSATSKSTNRYFNINDSSNNVRLSQFYSAVKTIQEKPIFGLGADQFSYNVKDIKERYGIWSKNYIGHSHNIFLEHAANYGIPGLIFFLGFLIFWFIEMVKHGTDFSWVVASYIVAFTVAGQVELLFDVINSHLIFFVYAFSQFQLQGSGENSDYIAEVKS